MVARPQPPHIEEDGGDLSLVLRAAQAALEHEFQIAERLDSKVRALLTITGAWFAVTVGVTGAVLAQPHPPARAYGYAIFVLAVGAVVALVGAGYYGYGVLRLQPEDELAPRALLEMAAVARDPDDSLASKLVDSYASLLASKRDKNKTRAGALQQSAVWAAMAMLAATAQLLAVVIASVFG